MKDKDKTQEQIKADMAELGQQISGKYLTRSPN